jgi:hypothetical protein
LTIDGLAIHAKSESSEAAKGQINMKALTAIVTAMGVLAFSGSAFAQCSSKSHTPMPDQTADTPIPIIPESVGS